MPMLLTGTVTFLYTDIEGSTRLLQALGEQYVQVVSQQRRRVIDIVRSHEGDVVDAYGDMVFTAFARAKDAAEAAVEVQRSIAAYPWPAGSQVRIRIGVHTGEPMRVESGYVGIDVHRAARICAAGHGGQILLSGTTRGLIVDDLPQSAGLRDLGQHRLKDLARPLHLYQLVVPDLPSQFPPLKSLTLLPNNLPSLLTSFVGRQQEMEDIKQMLSRSRLVTLTGMGGGGKTRLALQVAAELLDTYPDGVWFVELTSLTDPALITHTVISTLGLREEPGRPVLQTLLDYLESRRPLLIMDNCEHLLRESAGLAHTLLLACPNLHILATSREPLHVPGEAAYRISSLQVPDSSEIAAGQLVEFEAAQLFIDRAVTVRPSFKLSQKNARTIATICRRLDGIPLAIELAASRSRALSLEQIAERLKDRFALLTEHGRVDIPQHQTLQAVMDWSHDLLSPRERTVLRRLSVFIGGFALEAAEQVCQNGLGIAEVLDPLTHLVDKSLVQYQPDTDRYDLLETVRQYAWARLHEAGETDQVAARHLAFFLRVAESAEIHLRSAEALTWLDRVEAEHDNLRASLRWTLERGSGAGASRIGGALWWFWLVRGYWSEGRDWLERVLPKVGPGRLRAKLLTGAAMLAFYEGEYERAAALAQEALTLCRALPDRAGAAHALCLFGEIVRARGEYDRAVAFGEESVALFQEVKDSWGSAFSRLALGITIERDEPARAAALFEESLRLFRTAGDPWGILNTLSRLGRIARARGDFSRAEQLYRESRVLSEELRDNWGIAAALVNLGRIARVRGNYVEARELLERSLTLFERLGDKSYVTYALEELGSLTIYEGDSQHAIQLLTRTLSLARQREGDKLGLAVCLHRLGFAKYVEGNLEDARTLLEESLSLFRDLHEKLAIAVCLSDLGKILLNQGAREEAARLQKESLALRTEFGAKFGIAECLERIATIAGVKGASERAAQLVAAADAIRESIGVPLPPTERPDHERTIAVAASALGETSYARAWSEGRSMTLEQAIDYALATAP